jgi:hypothetical protein
MDIVKCEGIEPEFKKILITGVEKSGKTSFIGTMPRPILIFAGETGAETRFAGQKEIDVVRCYDQRGEREGSGYERFAKNWKELLTMKDIPYKTIAIDPLSFISDYIVDDVSRKNPGLKGSSNTFKFWDLVSNDHYFIMKNVLKMAEYVVVTSHVTIDEDETTGRNMFMPNLNGKALRNNIGGWFDAVLFTLIKPVGQTVEFKVLALPDSQRKAGIRVPIGCEGLVAKEMPSDFAKINAILKKEAKKQ